MGVQQKGPLEDGQSDPHERVAEAQIGSDQRAAIKEITGGTRAEGASSRFRTTSSSQSAAVHLPLRDDPASDRFVPKQGQ